MVQIQVTVSEVLGVLKYYFTDFVHLFLIVSNIHKSEAQQMKLKEIQIYTKLFKSMSENLFISFPKNALIQKDSYGLVILKC